MDPEIIKRLDALAEKLGATGTHLWGALVRREVVSGLVWGGISLLLALFFVGIALLSFTDVRKERAGEDSGAFTVMMLGFCAFLLLIFFGVGANLTAVLEPEGAVLKSLLGR